MGGHLRICVSRFHLLVDTCHVREVLEVAGEGSDAAMQRHGRRLWRGNSLRALDLRRLLDDADPPPAHAALVYAENGNEAPVVLLCDQVIGLVRAPEASFCEIPPLMGRIKDFFDRLVPDPVSGRLLLCLKPGILQNEHDMSCFQ